MELNALCWLESLLEERFGQRFSIRQEGAHCVLRMPGNEGAIVFDRLEQVFDQSTSDFPCFQWDAAVEGWRPALDSPLPAPATSPLPSPLIEQVGRTHRIHYDILGLTYWMLTRLEEVGRTDLDEHDRFPAKVSHAYRHRYLERPIVDEWLHILGQVILRVWPSAELRKHRFSVQLSHDVDLPSRYGFRSGTGLLRAVGGDVLRRRDFASVVRGPWVRLNTRAALHPSDPANTFDWLMDISERHGLKSAFYFICGRTNVAKDADYEPEHSAIRELMRRIHRRGHEIGLHPSYNTYRDPESLVAEAARLKRVCAQEGIAQSCWGGRMHYLRWAQPTTLNGWEAASMTYDSTLGYADAPGFRCGTCFEYPAFDPVAGCSLALRIRPLVAMECTVTDSRYLGLGAGDAAAHKFIELINACKAVSGAFTLLWHNSNLMLRSERALYKATVESAAFAKSDM